MRAGRAPCSGVCGAGEECRGGVRVAAGLAQEVSGLERRFRHVVCGAGEECRGGVRVAAALAQEVSGRLQHGVLRSNCIDCLDRTNVAQFAYGIMALGHQLLALGVTDDPVIDIKSSLAREFMDMYEACGHMLAQQVCVSHTTHPHTRARSFSGHVCLSVCLQLRSSASTPDAWHRASGGVI
jgi:hypothetical protein